jgi:hypothetical protein
MKISVLTKVFNEEDLMPFFLSHYTWADEIIVNLDEGTNDMTLKILGMWPNVKIIWSKSTGKMDDGILINELNKIAFESDADWLILVDSDEFVFPSISNGSYRNPRQVLEQAKGNLIWASMWQIYKHETDKDLDYFKPAIFQRRHGDPDRETGFNALYTKPIIVKEPRKLKMEWAVGNHNFAHNPRVVYSMTQFDGAHWTLPDIEITYKRRVIGRRNRFSDNEIKNGWGGQHFQATRESINTEYELHKNDPQVF